MINKLIPAVLLAAGAAATAYGMMKDNNIIFITGLVITVSGYLIVRRTIKKPEIKNIDQDY